MHRLLGLTLFFFFNLEYYNIMTDSQFQVASPRFAVPGCLFFFRYFGMIKSSVECTIAGILCKILSISID